MEVDFVSNMKARSADKTKVKIATAIELAKERRFEYDGRTLTYDGLSVCMKRIIDKMSSRVGSLVGTGQSVRDAVDSGIHAARNELGEYAQASLDQAEDILLQMLDDARVERLLRKAHKRMVRPAANTRKRTRHRALQPVMAH